jgi:hypothetical protein
MRRLLLAVLSAVLLLGTAAPAMAHPTSALDPTIPTDLTHASTDNVEYLGRFPEHAGTAGGRLSDDGTLFYLTDPRGVFIYDVTTPESPELMGSVAVFQQTLGVALAQEDPDTDGHILLVDGATAPFGPARLQVVDVADPTAPTIIGSVGTTDHTWTCVTGVIDNGETRGCAYAYGRTGHIIDLTDPANPVNLTVTWRQAVDHGARSNSPYVHDLTEIRPGLVMTAGAAAILMDTTDPAAPSEVARISEPGRFSSLGYHSVEWALDDEGGLDPFVVLGTEIAPAPAGGPNALQNTAGSDCKGDNSVIEVWDASEVVAALDGDEAEAPTDPQFTRLDTFDAGGRGIFLTGNAPAHQLYCAHWMDIHPDFAAGGLLTVSYYDRGTRFVEVDADGMMREIGWMVPAEGYSGSSRWITDEVVYIMDYRRGMEVVKVDTGTEATGVTSESRDVLALRSAYEPHSPLEGAAVPYAALALFGLLLFGNELHRLRRRRATRA